MIKEGFNKYFWDVIRNHYADFSGRVNRKQFWLFVLWNMIINAILRLIGNIFLTEGTTGIIIMAVVYMIYWFAMLVPYLAINVRRFRDAGFSVVLFVILQCLSFLGFILLLFSIFKLILAGTNAANSIFIGLLGISLLLAIACSVANLILCIMPTKQEKI